MYRIEIDATENRLMVVFSGIVDEVQAEQYLADLELRVPQELQQGFEVLTDLSEMEHLSHQATFFVRKSMDLLNHLGVKRIVRVIPHPTRSFAFNLMSHFHYDRDVRIVTCKSREEGAATMTPA